MKGKLDVRFGLPFVNRLRSRVENPSKTLSADIRQALGEVVVEVLNEQNFAIRTKLIKRVAEMDLKFKTKNHELQVMSAINNVFDSVFASKQEQLDALMKDEALAKKSEAHALDEDPDEPEPEIEEPEAEEEAKEEADPDDFD